MIEASQVDQLDGRAGVDGPIVQVRAELRGQLGQEWAEAFPSGHQSVPGDLGQESIIGV